jgi:hypothetical protein
MIPQTAHTAATIAAHLREGAGVWCSREQKYPYPVRQGWQALQLELGMDLGRISDSYDAIMERLEAANPSTFIDYLLAGGVQHAEA